jgi:hypothetical protein
LADIGIEATKGGICGVVGGETYLQSGGEDGLAVRGEDGACV